MVDFFRYIFYKRRVPRLVEKMNRTINLEEARWAEDQLLGSVLGTIVFVASILNFAFRLYWQDPLSTNLTTTFFLLIFGIGIDYCTFKIRHHLFRVIFLSAMVTGIIVTITVSYYDRVNVVIWTAIFLLIMLSVVRLDKILFTSIAITSIALGIHFYLAHLDEVVVLNKLYHSTQVGLLISILFVGILWNNIYHNRFIRIQQQYKDIVGQKEEITQLYEEATATEEELRVQNERLYEYNQAVKKHQEQLNFMAYNDELTGLPNRKMIIEKMQLLMALSKEDQSGFALMFLDINGLKKINDTMGHDVGDTFLIEISNRLKDFFADTSTVGRFGGDEFAVILPKEAKEKLYDSIVTLRDSFQKSFQINNHNIDPIASFGIALYPDDGEGVDSIIKSADAAIMKAKETGSNIIQFYHKELEEEILNRIRLEQELKDALKKDEFFLLYQPQVTINKNMMEGFEALIRWQSPTRGLVTPFEFIPILEETGLIHDVGEWVLKKACEKLLEFRGKGIHDRYISINVSGIQLNNPDYVSRVDEIVAFYAIDPETLQLELTESVFIENLERTIEQIEALKAMGMAIALDDFGTGYSSLSYLRRLPIDVLKIDRSFIWDLDKGDKERKIVGSIIDLVHDMDISVVAEGVETEFQKDYLEKENCDHIQGYLISRPLSDEKTLEFIKDTDVVIS